MKTSIPRSIRSSVRGLSMLDTVMTLSMLAAVTGLVMPAAAGMVDRARATRAQREVNAIAAALMEYYRDVGMFPGGEKRHYHQRSERLVLVSEGEMPEAANSLAMQLWVESPTAPLSSFLRKAPEHAGDRWRGPYLPQSLGKDPWGQAYLVNISCAISSATSGERKMAVFVLSAGPNGVVNTPFYQYVSDGRILGDDIAVRMQ